MLHIIIYIITRHSRLNSGVVELMSTNVTSAFSILRDLFVENLFQIVLILCGGSRGT